MNTSLKALSAFLLLGLQFISTSVSAYDISIMPVRSQAKTEELYAPMVEYFTKSVGVPITLKTYKNFVDYWQDMRHGKFELAFGAAHFVDYLVANHQHQVLAKLKDRVSFSLVTTQDDSVFEASELVGKPIACLAAPSRGNLEISTFFKSPMRQPRKTEVRSYEEGVVLLEKGTVKAAVLPTPMVQIFTDLHLVESTELWPHMGVTESPEIPTEVKSKITRALLSMKKNMQGNEALEASNLVGFEPADSGIYEGYSKYLSHYIRYTQ